MEEKGFDGMNVMPLVDVMLVLLTIVLTTSSFIASGQIPLSLPKAEAEAVTSVKDRRIIAISAEGLYYLDQQPQSLEELKGHLIATSKKVALVIRADEAVRLQSFVTILDLVKTLKFENVHMETEAK